MSPLDLTEYWATQLPVNSVCYDRLSILCLPSLELRRLHIDLIMRYKIVFGIADVKFDDFFKRSSVVATRGHAFKLFKETSSCSMKLFLSYSASIYIFLPLHAQMGCPEISFGQQRGFEVSVRHSLGSTLVCSQCSAGILP